MPATTFGHQFRLSRSGGLSARHHRRPAEPAGFSRGVALGPMLEKKFKLPVFINNDGDLFAYGESIAGFLPHVNALLEKAGSPKRYQNLLGVTLGTGFGGGIVRNGELFLGDNSLSGEVWLLRNKLFPTTNVEHSVSIRAVRRVYAELAGIAFDAAPEPREIGEIGQGTKPGNQKAALEAFRQLGEAAGDAIGIALTLVDGLVVIGGGISGAWPLFLPALVDELNAHYEPPQGGSFRRLTAKAFNLEDPAALENFCVAMRAKSRFPAATIPFPTILCRGSAWEFRGWARAKPWRLARMRSRCRKSRSRIDR